MKNNNILTMGLKVVQVGANKGSDELFEYINKNYSEIEFGLFVEANKFHIDDLKKCYQKYDNVIVENIAVKTPLQKEDILTIYYHTNEYPHYGIATCNIEHLKKHMEWCPHLQGGEIKSFEVNCITLDDLLEKYSLYEFDILFLDIEGIDAEVLLTFDWEKYSIKRVEFEHLHLGEYSDCIKNMMKSMNYIQVDSLHEYNWAFEKKVDLPLSEKLKNFAPVHFVSIEESEDRRNLLYKKFEDHGIDNFTPHVFKRYDDSEHIVKGKLIHNVTGKGRGPTTSHLKAIKDWYFDTDDEYAFFCEDDLSFETVPYWNFTWQEFFNALPDTWQCVQLSWVRNQMFEFSPSGIFLRSRCWCDWSACAFLIKRSHAKNLIANYYRNGEFNLDYIGIDAHLRTGINEWALNPIAEQIIYTNFDSSDKTTIYGFPLFVEDVINCKSTMYEGSVLNYESYNSILEWWKTEGINRSLDELIPN